MHLTRTTGLWLVVLVLAAIGAAPASATAQTVTGTIQGTVVDTSGGVLPGVTIVVKHVDTGAERTLVTNESGIYSAPYVAIGKYTDHGDAGRLRAGHPRRHHRGTERHRGGRFQARPPAVGRHHRHRRRAAHQYHQRRGQGIADRGTDHGQADRQPGLLPRAGRDLHRLPGEPDLGPEQPDRLVRVVDQLQRHRHARRHLPDQRRQQRRLVREPEPAGSGALDDQGIPGHQATATRRSSAAATAPSCWCRPNPAPTRSTAMAIWFLQDNAWNAKALFSARPRQSPSHQRNQYGGTRGLPDQGRTGCSASPASIARRYEGRTTTRATCSWPASSRAASLTRGNDTPANRAWIQSVLDRFPSGAVAERPAQQPHLRHGRGASTGPTRTTRGARLERGQRQHRAGATSTRTSCARPRTGHPASTPSRTTRSRTSA